MKQGDYVLYTKGTEIKIGKVGSFDAFKQKARVIPLKYGEQVILRKKKVLTPVDVFMKKYGKIMKGE